MNLGQLEQVINALNEKLQALKDDGSYQKIRDLEQQLQAEIDSNDKLQELARLIASIPR